MAKASFYENSPQPPGSPPAQSPGNVPNANTSAPSSFYKGTGPLVSPANGLYNLTPFGVLYGDGILAPLATAPGINGQFLAGFTGGAPLFRGITAADVPASALTGVNDTNVTLTLGGSPTTALLNAASITLGWTGTLAAARLNANVVQGITNDTNITGSIAAQNLTLGWTGTLAAARLNANVVQGITNDTNVTGSIAAQVLTLGWTGLLGLARGGTNANLSATGGASQVLRQSSAGAAITVGQLAASDLSNGTTGSGAVVLATSPSLTTISVANATFNPGANVLAAVTLTGSFGGGLVFSDTGFIGLWSTGSGANLNMGVGGTAAGIASTLQFNGTTLNLSGGGSWFKCVGSDSGLDLGNGTTVQRKSSDGRMQFNSQNTLFEFTGPIIGGQAAGSTLTLESTSGAGTSDLILFKTGSQVERLRIDTTGNIVGGGFASIIIDSTRSIFQSIGTTTAWNYSGVAYGNNAFANTFAFAKTRGATPTTQTAVAANDQIFGLTAYASDGTSFVPSNAIQFLVDGTVTTGSVPTRFTINTGSSGYGVERLRIDSAGYAIFGGSAATTAIYGAGAGIQLQKNALYMFDWSNVANGGPQFYTHFSRGASIGTHGAVVSGDRISYWVFAGDDGTNFKEAALISTWIDGTVSAGNTPGRIQFHTTSVGGGGFATERLRIDNAGGVIVANGTTAGQAIALVASNNTRGGGYSTAALRSDTSWALNLDAQGDININLDIDNNSTNFFRVFNGANSKVFEVAETGEATVSANNATPAGGSTSARLLFGTTAGFGIYYGSGAPTVSAAQGSIYIRSDGSSTSTRLYVNTNGTTGWTNFTSAA